MTKKRTKSPAENKRRTKFNIRSSICFGESLLPLL